MPHVDPEEQREMDEAAREFALEFRAMIGKMVPEQRGGVVRAIELIDKYCDTAGYRRMCRFMRSERRKIQ